MQIRGFLGLDVRSEVTADPRAQLQLDNLYIDATRHVRSRPGAVKVARVNEHTVGLYSFGGALRCAAPAGRSAVITDKPLSFVYDLVGDGSIYAEDALQALEGVEFYDNYPILTLRRNDALELHAIDIEPPDLVTAVSTRIRLPFILTGAPAKLSRKLWAPAAINGTIPYSSTQFGPRDWAQTEDAGFLPVSQHISGNREITAVGYFRNSLAVAFVDGMQVWATDPDPENIYLTDNFNGPGAAGPRCLENVLGDLWYVNAGGIRTLQSTLADGAKDLDVGARINPLLAGVDLSGGTALWSQSRSQFFFVLSNTVYVANLYPQAKILAWSRWAFPFTITDITEHQGFVYLRASDHTIYRLVDGEDADDGTPIAWAFRTHFLDGNDPSTYKMFRTMSVDQEGTSVLTTYTNPGVPDAGVGGRILVGRTSPHAKVFLAAMTTGLSLKLSGTGRWLLRSLTVDTAR
jgi:hypothetical protein